MTTDTRTYFERLSCGGSDYRVVRSLGVGSMGEVFLVENLTQRRLEALKILPVESAHNPALAARFRREGRALRRLQHPNVVAVYDHGELPDHGGLYVAMEYASGPDLEQVFATEPRFVPARATAVLEQLAAAIDHTHERGVVHRDLKPGNLILVQLGGHELLKVMDFGIAKIFALDYDGTSPTSQGVCFGTPAYMAPEQFGDSLDDPRIDIYALGCIGYELLTGAPPFRGSVAQLFQAHMRQVPPRPSQVAPEIDVPSGLEDVIMRCLEKRGDDRFQRGQEIVEALRGLSRPAARASTVTSDDEDTRIERRPGLDTTLIASPVEREGQRDLQRLLVELGEALLDLDGPGSELAAPMGAYLRLADSLERWRAHAHELSLQQQGGRVAAITELQIATAATAARMEEAVQLASDALYAALTHTAQRYLGIDRIALSARRLGNARSAVRR